MNRPPTMATTPCSKLSIERRAASTLVAFESLTNRTCPIRPAGSIACSRRRGSRAAPSSMARASTPARPATAEAASTLPNMWRPVSSTAASGSEPLDVRARSPHDPLAVHDNTLVENARERERDAACRDGRAFGHDHRIIGVQYRPIVCRSDCAKIRALADRVRLEGRMPIEVVGREVQPDGDPRPERRRRLQLKAADLDDVDRLRRRVDRPAR